MLNMNNHHLPYWSILNSRTPNLGTLRASNVGKAKIPNTTIENGKAIAWLQDAQWALDKVQSDDTLRYAYEKNALLNNAHHNLQKIDQTRLPARISV